MAVLLAALMLAQDSGVELTYRVEFPADFKGLRRPVAERTLGILQKRAADLKGSMAGRLDDEHRLVLRVAKGDLERLKPALSRMGKLEFLASAPDGIQKRFAKDGVVPEGYRELENPDPRPDPEFAVWGRRVLVAKTPVVDQSHIVRADAVKREWLEGFHWATAFELNEEGAKRFDEAAKDLFDRRPPGMIAIVVDGKVHSMPRVNSESFHGRGEISGAKDESDARAQAAVLGAGALPFPVELVSENPFGPAGK